MTNAVRVEVDIERIEGELREFANGTHFKLRAVNNLHTDAGHPLRVSVRETDKGVSIKINPKRIKTQEQLDEVLRLCRLSLGGE